MFSYKKPHIYRRAGFWTVMRAAYIDLDRFACGSGVFPYGLVEKNIAMNQAIEFVERLNQKCHQ